MQFIGPAAVVGYDCEIVVLSAGDGNDIIGWTSSPLLSVAFVNVGPGLPALHIHLNCVGWTLFPFFPVKMALRWLARTKASIESGPPFFTMMVLFDSAFFIDVIGLQAVLGASLAVLIILREEGVANPSTEQLEDMIPIIFLQLGRRDVFLLVTF